MNYLINQPKFKIEPIEIENDLIRSIYFRECKSCSKKVKIHKENRYLEEYSANFFCPFCIRNNFNNKNRKNIIALSFRGLISYYYEHFYKETGEITFSQIKDMINMHEKIGSLNPIMHYDQETYLWFIDFTKQEKYHFNFEQLLDDLWEIMMCFDPEEFCVDTEKFFSKFEKALRKFGKNRHRPKGKKLLIPTLNDCSIHTKLSRRNFFEKDMKIL